MEEQLNIFDFTAEGGQEAHRQVAINKPIRLIEFFAGYGSQAMALRNIGADFEHWFVCEFDKYAIKSYNAIHNTEYHTIDIRNVKGLDLKITDTDKYLYFLTYSFPCTDLSVAGKQLGMSKGGGTRSGLLWEVERILQEIVDSNGELPQLLMMENVPQVHGTKFKADFDNWCNFLESIGYVNFWQDLNAKNYGVAQNRNRTFMFSFLKSEFGNNPQYKFPEPIPLEKRLKDYLEDEVDEKYYINNEKAQKLIDTLIENGTLENSRGYADNNNCDKPGNAFSETDRSCNNSNGERLQRFWKSRNDSRIAVDGTINEPKEKDIANCIKARVDAGISNFRSDGTMVVEKEKQ